ncbi:MAG: DUF4956 domain-containing protein [Clostridiales bacterium]|nr:DUF4956 domain-containing protein [Clostridiales bacterium]
MIKKSILESGGFIQSVSAQTIIGAAVQILLALAIGLILYVLYRKTYSGVVYSQSFAVSLAGMAVMTCTIIVTIQSNVVLSLGMVGALSIVRYRTAVKEPMDLMFLFMAVTTGIATGAGMFYIAVISLIIMSLLLFILRRRKHRREEMYILLVHYTGEGIDEEIRRAIGTNPYQIKSKTMRKQDVEMAVEVRVKNNALSFLD